MKTNNIGCYSPEEQEEIANAKNEAGNIKVIGMTDTWYKDILRECIRYIANEEDMLQTRMYLLELVDAMFAIDRWKVLTDTGIFHDAIDKVICIQGNFIQVATEY